VNKDSGLKDDETAIIGVVVGKRFKTCFAVVHDSIMAAASVPLAALMISRPDQLAIEKTAIVAVLFSIFAIICFRLVGMYKGIWRYASIGDLFNIVRAATLSVVLFSPSTIMFVREDGNAYTLPIMQWLLLMLMLGAPRLMYRAWKDGFMNDFFILSAPDKSKNVSNILMIGAGDAAELFIRSLKQNRVFGYRVVGLLDERRDRQGREIHGVPVLGRPSELDRVLDMLANTSKRPQRLIFSEAVPKTGEGHFLSAEDLAKKVDQYGLKVARLPSMTEFKDGLAQGQGALQLKPIAIEDLLGRPQAMLDLDAIKNFVSGARVLITGCGGTIGSELARQIAAFRPSELVLLDNGEYNLYSIDYDVRDKWPTLNVSSYICSIRDHAALGRIFDHHKPELVFHAAALKHVPLVELNPCEGILTNVVGTRNVAECARRYGARAMVQISTDKAVNPTNVMGASKRLGEYYAQALDLDGIKGKHKAASQNAKEDTASDTRTRFITVRFGNVLGSSGSVVPLFRKQLENGGPLTVTHPDIKRYFMTVKEAVSLVLQASAHGMVSDEDRGRIFVLDMGEPMKIVDVARQMIRLANLQPDVDIKIVFSGLRPGEKLFEELFDRNEKPVETGIPGVMAAIPQPIDLSLLAKTIDHLDVLANEGDEDGIIRKLASVVPGYQKESYDQSSPMAKNKKTRKEAKDA